VLAAFIIRAIVAQMMEAVSTSETSVSFYETTRRSILEDSHLHVGAIVRATSVRVKFYNLLTHYSFHGCNLFDV
jgi:hypothetical protein